MQSRGRVQLIVVLVLAIAGCQLQQQRYAVVPRPRTEVLAEIDERARRAGFEPTGPHVAAKLENADAWDQSYTGKLPAPLATDPDHVKRYTFDVAATELDGQTYVALATGDGDLALSRVIPEGRTHLTILWPILDAFAWDMAVEVATDRARGRLDAIGRAGYRWTAPVARGFEPVPRYGVALLAGAGFVEDLDRRSSLRADVTLAVSRQAVAEPVPGHRLAGIPLAASASLAYLHGYDHAGRAVELELTAEIAGSGGPFVRAGYAWGPDGRGRTAAVGFKAGTRTVAGIASAVVAAALYVGIIYLYTPRDGGVVE